MAPVLLKRWSPLFDPEREQIGAGPLWVRLSGLPLQYWSEEAFVKIGNALGTYLDHDRSYKETNKRILARILVHLDTREGLQEKMTLRWGNFNRSQILDYEGVPFRCNKCHQVGHVYKDCPLNATQEGPPKPATIASCGVPTSIPRLPHCSSGPQGEPAKLDKRKIASPSPPLTRARATAAAALVSDNTPIPNSNSSDISSALEYSTACTMVQCDIPPPPPPTSTAPPTLPFTSPPPSPPSSRLTPSHPYSLRPRISHPEVFESLSGLGIVPLGPGFLSTRGRKSYLNHANRHAGAEVAVGRQATIDGVLKATKPPKIGPP